jgi:hypothetical protein
MGWFTKDKKGESKQGTSAAAEARRALEERQRQPETPARAPSFAPEQAPRPSPNLFASASTPPLARRPEMPPQQRPQQTALPAQPQLRRPEPRIDPAPVSLRAPGPALRPEAPSFARPPAPQREVEAFDPAPAQPARREMFDQEPARTELPRAAAVRDYRAPARPEAQMASAPPRVRDGEELGVGSAVMGALGLGPRPTPAEQLHEDRRLNVMRYFGPPRKRWPWAVVIVVSAFYIWGGLMSLYREVASAIQYDNNILDALYNGFPGTSLVMGGAVIAFALWRILLSPTIMSDRQIQALVDHDLDWKAIKHRAQELSGVDASAFERSGFRQQAFSGFGFADATRGEFSGYRFCKDGVARFTPLGVTVVNATENQLYIYTADIDLTTGNWLHERSTELQLADVVSVRLEDVNFSGLASTRSWLAWLKSWFSLARWGYWFAHARANSPVLQLFRAGQKDLFDQRYFHFDESKVVNGVVQTSYARRMLVTSADGQVISTAVPGKGAISPGLPPLENAADPALTVTQSLRKYVRDLKLRQ